MQVPFRYRRWSETPLGLIAFIGCAGTCFYSLGLGLALAAALAVHEVILAKVVDAQGASCPRCGTVGRVRRHFERGLYLSCTRCGPLRGASKRSFRIVPDPSLAPITDSRLDRAKVDLLRFRAGDQVLGKPYHLPPASVADAPIFNAVSTDEGVWISVTEGRVQDIVLEPRHFHAVVANGAPAGFGTETTEADVTRVLGAPYWRAEDEDEVMLFYEIEGRELQIEIEDKQHVSMIVLILEPLLADAEQRKSYGVTREWPPVSRR